MIQEILYQKLLQNYKYKNYKAIQYIDSFIYVHNNQIQKNNALKEHYEGLCTKQMLPLIDKKGFYDDIPFMLITTATRNGIAAGNFVYSNEYYFVKVSCIISKELLLELKENEI